MYRSKKTLTARSFLYVFLIIFAVIIFYPIFLMFLTTAASFPFA